MTLQELLEELREGILRDTSDQVEGVDTRLWSDTRLVRYINEAQVEFAKKSLILRPKATITTVAYQRDYEMDPAVFAIVSARFQGNGSYVAGQYTLNTGLPVGTQIVYPDMADLGRTGHAMMETFPVPDERYFDVNLIDRLPPGKPQVFYTDEQLDEDNASGAGGVMNVRLYPPPSPQFAGCQIELRQIRKPRVDLTVSNMLASPEVPVEYHMKLLDYAAFKALSMADRAAEDMQRANARLQLFKQNCETARQEVLNKLFAPMGWGFGTNGFSYTGN